MATEHALAENARNKEEAEGTYRQIWSRMPERHGPFSSAWWFFLLLPRREHGFGPAQIMYAIMARAGDFFVDEMPVDGMKGPPANGAAEILSAFALGWMHDGEALHERLVYGACRATLDTASGRLSTGSLPGPEVSIEAAPGRPYGIHARFEGQRGGAEFDVWGDPATMVTRPVVSIDRPQRITGGHVIGWERLSFEGRFRTPVESYDLDGIGFFQRVCANSPVVPWKWVYVVFADESIFSCFIPFLGPHLARRRHGFFSQRVEQWTFAPMSMCMFSDGATGEVVSFEDVRVVPRLAPNGISRFDIRARSAAGDRVTLNAVPYDHSGYTLSRPMMGDRVRSRYVYNEYLLRTESVAGVIGGRPLASDRLGTGFGNCEYNWGFTP